MKADRANTLANRESTQSGESAAASKMTTSRRPSIELKAQSLPKIDIKH